MKNKAIDDYKREYTHRLCAAAEDLTAKLLNHSMTASDLGGYIDMIDNEAEAYVNFLKDIYSQQGAALPEEKAEIVKNNLICAHIKATGKLFERVNELYSRAASQEEQPTGRNAFANDANSENY